MNINTGKLNFQVSPVAIANERLEARMYQPFNNRGPYFYPMSPFAKMPSMKGLGRLGAAVPNYTCPPISEQPGACAWAGTSQLQDSMNNTGFPNDMAGYLAEQQAAWNADGYCSTWQQQQLSCIQALVSGGTSPDMQNAAALDAAVKAALSTSTTTTPITSGGGSSVAQIPTFTLINETSGETISTGGSFNQGDGFQVVITNAAPNAPVTVTATQNGQSSTSVLGNTNSSGSFQTSGTMGPSAAGNWAEQWSVPAGTGALALAASVSFTVSSTAGSAASSGASSGGSSGSAGSSGSTGSGNSGGSNTNVSAAACGLSLGSSDTSSCVNLGFMTVSADALLVGAAIGAALLFFAGRGK